MGADRHEKDRKNRLPPFVPLLISTLDSPAWQAMSHGAQALYVALRRRYSPALHNNGRIYLSQRKAKVELRSGHNQIARWFRELQHYGFIVMTTAGCLGVEGRGKAPHWRLTELGYMRDPPTREFARWNSERFTDQKTESRARKPSRGVPETKHTTVPEIHHGCEPERARKLAHIAAETVPEIRHISSLPSLCSFPSDPSPQDSGERGAPSKERASEPRSPVVSDELAALVRRGDRFGRARGQ
jgi:hypothetical protein